jgi:hypothetical protein
MVWNMSNLDLEWFYGPEPAQKRYADGLLRAESLGRQSGNIPLVLARDGTHRTSTMLVHEIKAEGPEKTWWDAMYDFGYGQKDCAVFNYWNPDYPVSVSNPGIRTLLLKRGSELLLAACSWNSQAEQARLKLDTRALGLSPKAVQSIVKAEGACSYDPDTGTITLDLPAYGEALLKFN